MVSGCCLVPILLVLSRDTDPSIAFNFLILKETVLGCTFGVPSS
jgi:hypothetical protein